MGGFLGKLRRFSRTVFGGTKRRIKLWGVRQEEKIGNLFFFSVRLTSIFGFLPNLWSTFTYVVSYSPHDSLVSYSFYLRNERGFPGGTVLKNLPANAGDTRDTRSISGLGRSPGVGNGNLLRYSCLEKSHQQWSLAGYSSWDHKK